MASRGFRRELAQNLSTWQENGWVTPEGATALQIRYSLDKEIIPLGSIIRAVFGAALLLGGLILVLAHNWNDLDRTVRVGIALLPLSTTIGIGAWVLYTRQESIALREGLALANSLAVALAISLVAQTYHISGDLPGFVLTWALCTLPAVFLLHGAVTWVLFQVLAVTWAWNIHPHSYVLPGYLALTATSLTVFHPRLWLTQRPYACTAISFPLVLCITVALSAPLQSVSGSGWHLIAHALWLGIIWMAADLHPVLPSALLRLFSALGMAILLVILSFDDIWRHFRLLEQADAPALMLWSSLAWIAALIVALVLFSLRKRATMDRFSWLCLATAFLPIAGYGAKMINISDLEIMIVVNFFAAAISFEAMRSGLRKMDAVRLNFGWLLFSALVISRFFDSDLNYLVRGLVFIALGLGFLGINSWIKRRQSTAAKGGAQ